MIDLLPRLQTALAGRYAIERELGHGGMACVFLAQDLKHHRAVAIKLLRPELAATLGADRFLREIEIAARLTHPHILPLHDSGEAEGLLYYVMPYVEGESLRGRLDRERQLPLEEALQIALEVADALSCAHSQGVVHRDIKPENILLEMGHAVVSDFGIARAISAAGADRLTETGLVVGTPAYMSPEQAGGSQVDGRSDVYALGCVLYEMLTGEPPFSAPSAQAMLARHSIDPVRPIRTVRKAVPAGVELAIMRALEKVPADRFDTAADLAQALESGSAARGLGAPARGPRTPLALAFLGALTLMGAGLFWRSRSRLALETDLLAVAPFEVLDTKLTLWQEGLMDVLSRSLDGAGPLRTVSPSTVVRRWRGHPDPASAAQLGRLTGASLVVFGSLMDVGADSVRLAASLFDVATDRTLADIEVRGQSERMDRLADSLTVALLRELGRTRAIGAVRSASLGSSSMPALKAFLRGDQFYRRAAWDSALAHYQHAVALDSTFALAWRGMSGVMGCWRRAGAGDPLGIFYGLRAGALNRGLPPRDSLLITADSLFQALYDGPADPRWREHRARLFATLTEATRRYPKDPEIWFQLGDAMVHHPAPGRPMLEQALEAFDRAIALDSAFGPAYIHPVELSIQLGRPEAAPRYLTRYLALQQADFSSEGMGLVAALFFRPEAGQATIDPRLDTVSSRALFAALWVARHVTDSAEAVIRLARAFAASRSIGDPDLDDPLTRQWALVLALAHRGHLQEASAVSDARLETQIAELALLGAMPAERARGVFARWLKEPLTQPVDFESLEARVMALPWWAAQGDTTSLDAATRQWDSLAKSAPLESELGLWARYGGAAGRAYLALAEKDTAEAMRGFAGLPDSVCPCLFDRIMTAQLLLASGRPAEAATLVEQAWPLLWDPAEGLWWLERARVAERLGQRKRAVEPYRFVAELWRHADPGLEPEVSEARTALHRLGAEP